MFEGNRKASKVRGSPQKYLMKYYQETELCDFCCTESMIHMHLFHPVLFGCDNHVGFLNVLNLVIMPGIHTSGCPLLCMGDI